MQSTKLPDVVRQRVESAIHRNRYRVTAGEVAALAGITLAEAESALKALAYDAQAVLQVSLAGWHGMLLALVAAAWLTCVHRRFPWLMSPPATTHCTCC